MDLYLINKQLFTSQDINWWTKSCAHCIVLYSILLSVLHFLSNLVGHLGIPCLENSQSVDYLLYTSETISVV